MAIYERHDWPSAGSVYNYSKNKRPKARIFPKHERESAIVWEKAAIGAQGAVSASLQAFDEYLDARSLPADIVVVAEKDAEDGRAVIGFLMLGIMLGFVGAAVSLYYGSSVLVAFGVYCAVGAVVSMVLPCLKIRWR